jgi:hypothetical protein
MAPVWTGCSLTEDCAHDSAEKSLRTKLNNIWISQPEKS